jgi:hypothetical protein
MADPSQEDDGLSSNAELDTNENAPLLQHEQRNEPPPPFNHGFNPEGTKVFVKRSENRHIPNSIVFVVLKKTLTHFSLKTLEFIIFLAIFHWFSFHFNSYMFVIHSSTYKVL